MTCPETGCYCPCSSLPAVSHWTHTSGEDQRIDGAADGASVARRVVDVEGNAPEQRDGEGNHYGQSWQGGGACGISRVLWLRIDRPEVDAFCASIPCDDFRWKLRCGKCGGMDFIEIVWISFGISLPVSKNQYLHYMPVCMSLCRFSEVFNTLRLKTSLAITRSTCIAYFTLSNWCTAWLNVTNGFSMAEDRKFILGPTVVYETIQESINFQYLGP